MTDEDRRRLVEAQLRRLERNEVANARVLRRQHAHIRARFLENLERLQARMRQAVENGQEITQYWLYAEQRYKTMLEQYENATNAFMLEANRLAEEQAGKAIELASDDAFQRIKAELAASIDPEAGFEVSSSIVDSFQTISSESLVHAQKALFNADNATAKLFSSISGVTVGKIQDEFMYSIVSGQSIARTARNVRDIADIPYARALTITRTETMRVYRDTTQAAYEQSKAVEGWTWYAALDDRTCPVCWAMHGSEHDLDEKLESHPNCRCTMLPRTLTWRELGFDLDELDTSLQPETGPEQFKKLSDAEQKQVLGPSKYKAYKDGDIDLEDIPVKTNHPEWGGGLRQKNLTELGLRDKTTDAASKAAAKSVTKPPPAPKPPPEPPRPSAASLQKRWHSDADLMSDREVFRTVENGFKDSRGPIDIDAFQQYYSGGIGAESNSILRLIDRAGGIENLGGPNLERWNERVKNFVRRMDDNFAKLGETGSPIRLHRAVAMRKPEFRRTMMNLQPGDIIREPGYSSTSRADFADLIDYFANTADEANQLEIVIYAPHGSKAFYMDAHVEHAHPIISEILLPRGSRFKVIQPPRRTAGHYRMIVELMP